MSAPKIYSLAFCLLALGVVSAPGAVKTWNTTAGDWFLGANWNPATAPEAGDDVVITNTSASVILSNATPWLSSVTLNKTLTFTNWNSALNATNVTIQSGGVLTLPAAFTNDVPSNNVYVVCSNLTVDSGGSLNADYKGFSGGVADNEPGWGPGGTSDGGGAGYGGNGGRGEYGVGGNFYGSTNAPVAPGSGAGNDTGNAGGHGGGAIRIQAAGLVTVNGTISANGSGGTYRSGGGSGGGIFIVCNVFSGASGIVRANAGNGGSPGAGGGGGRIAVVYDTNAQSLLPVPSVQFSVNRGSNGGLSDLGTLYFPDNRFLTTTMAGHIGRWIMPPEFTGWSPATLTVSNAWLRFPMEGFQLAVANDLRIEGSSGRLDLGGNAFTNGIQSSLVYSEMTSGPSLTVGGNIFLTNGGILAVYGGKTNAAGANYGALVTVTGDVFIATNSWFYPYSHITNGGSVFFSMRSLTIANGGGINADGKGFAGWLGDDGPGFGPGGGPSGGGGGGGYGGGGGPGEQDVGGSIYGLANAPVLPGSGGSADRDYQGANAGGAIRIQATDTVAINGTLTADGASGYYRGGSGSGGGIHIACGTLTGQTNNTVIRANGGAKPSVGGGGGGGRIAIFAQRDELTGVTPGTYQGYSGSANGVIRVNVGTSGSGTNGTFYLLLPGTVVLIR